MNAVRRSQMEVRRGLADRKKITANGLVRRGRPEGVPLVRFDHSLFKHNGRLLRAMSHEQRATALFSESDAAFRRDRLMIVLRSSATRHKFWLCTGFATGRPTEHPPGRPLRYRIQAMGKKADTDYKKIQGPGWGDFTSRGLLEAMYSI